jgi:hypothetical protein
MFDTYHMDHARGLMFVDCDDIDADEPDLKDPRCLRAVLGNLCNELRVDGIVLNHYREKHYGRKTLKALREVIALSSLLDQLKGQEALPNFPGLAKKEVQVRCDACPFNPRLLFTSLREILLDGLPEINFPAFAAEFTAKARDLQRHKYKGCSCCTSRTVDDLSFLLSEIESFADKVLAPERGGQRP